MGLPCAHICDERRNTTGLTLNDFDLHWYWNRNNPRFPFLEPRPIIRRRQNTPTSKRTGRILSSFEALETPQRSQPLCSACSTRGHTRTSRNCPIRLQADIAESSRQLREHEVAQARRQLNETPIPPSGPVIESALLSGSTLLPSQLSDRVSDIFNMTPTRNNSETLPNHLTPTFRVPILLETIDEHDDNTPTSPINFTTLLNSSPVQPSNKGQLPLSPLKPLHPNRPEMI
jgi:hypothetical protein